MQEEHRIPNKWDLSQDCKVGSAFKIIKIHYINRQKRKSHMTTPMEKAFDKRNTYPW